MLASTIKEGEERVAARRNEAGECALIVTTS